MLTQGHKFQDIIVLGKLYEPRERKKLTVLFNQIRLSGGENICK